MDESKLSFEHYACLASTSPNEDQFVIDNSEYESHQPLADIDKGYELYELTPYTKNTF